MIFESLGFAWEVRPLLQLVIFAIGVLYSFKRGAEPERAVALTLIFMALFDRIYHLLAPQSTVLVWHFVLDALATIILVGIGILANRTYTLWIGSFQIIALSAHFARYVSKDDGLSLPFTILYIVPSYFQIGLLLWGTHCHARRQRRFGTYKSWKNSSQPSRASVPPTWRRP